MSVCTFLVSGIKVLGEWGVIGGEGRCRVVRANGRGRPSRLVSEFPAEYTFRAGCEVVDLIHPIQRRMT
jgi:hypothetical protein